MSNQREATGKRRRLLSWGLLAVAGLVAGFVGLATLSDSADGQTSGQPAEATNLTATEVTKTSATLTWEAGTGGCATTRYALALHGPNPDYAEFDTTRVSPPAALSWEVTGLTAGKTYRFQVIPYGASCDAWGNGAFVYFTTAGQVAAPTPYPASKNPSIPVNLAVGKRTQTSATLTWEAGTGGGCATTYYGIILFESSDAIFSSAQVAAATLTWKATGLTPGTKYYFTVEAGGTCGQGLSHASSKKSFKTRGAAPPPAFPNEPSGFTASSITDTTAVLSWTAGADGDCATTSYDVWIELRAGVNLWEREGVTVTTVTVTGLSAETTYTAFVDAYGSTCDENSDALKVTFTTLAAGSATNTPTPEPTTTVKPNAPTGLAANSITETRATLSWTAGADGSCATTSYDVLVETDVSGTGDWESVWERDEVTATTVAVTGLSRATVYFAQVESYGASCNEYALPLTIRFTTDGIPAKPAGVTATGGVGRVALAWTDLSDTTVTRWEYQQKTGTGSYGSWTAIGSSSATTTRHTVTGLAGGTTYAFKVRAVNPAGNSPASDEVTATTVPAKPTGVTATGGVRRATLAWTDPSDSTITSWEYQRKAGAGSYGSWTAIPSSSAPTTTYTVTGLSDGTVYAFKVRAVNPTGNSPASDEATAATAPAKPTNVTAAGGVKQATLTWTNPNYASITRWQYQQKAGSGNYGSWMAIPSSSAPTTTYTVTGLTDATTYAFKVRAVNPAGNGVASDEVTARTAPAKPTSVTATAGAQRVLLAWADPGDASITSWEYQQKQGSGAYGSWTAISGSSATTTTYTVRGLLAETTYAFKVRAVNPAGNGVASDEVTATTPQFTIVPGEETATPTPTGTPTPTPTATPTPPPGASPTPPPPPGATPPATATPSATPDMGAGDTDDDEPTEPDMGAGDTDDDEPAEPDTGGDDTDDGATAEPDTGAGGDIADDEPGIGDAGSGLATGGVSLAAISGVIALALALALGRPAWARRRR